ncbi:hypothetical protein DFP72DRAFT_1177263 [Ephemerocybe angulata]|uniref:Uncharacterized protein n=1 Tax=Ephemerocybe angulata TaxID=980116 RepID=A0A8H6LXA1_9AGAR|nr:hypothetical protein DFP72DRAFT_1177263 [Tulosesus angulatus]
MLYTNMTTPLSEIDELDQGKPRLEVMMAKMGAVIGRALTGAMELESWVGCEKDPVELPTFQPLCGAIAAACPALIKPSEVFPTFSKLLAELVPKYLDSAAYRLALGGILQITRILELTWAPTFHTGNSSVVRIISAAAGKYLTPMTLELGRKSPALLYGRNRGEEELRVVRRSIRVTLDYVVPIAGVEELGGKVNLTNGANGDSKLQGGDLPALLDDQMFLFSSKCDAMWRQRGVG